MRVYAMLVAPATRSSCREWLARGPDRANDRRLITRSVKAFYDGALGSRGARLLDDYSDRPGHRGVSGNQYGFDQKLVADMMKAGFQVAIHAIGDAGNRETLDFIESVLEDAAGVARAAPSHRARAGPPSRRHPALRPPRRHRLDGAPALRRGQGLGGGAARSRARQGRLRLAHAAQGRRAARLQLRPHRLGPRHLLRPPRRDHAARQGARSRRAAGIPRSA